jgi:hypothetical protein
MYERMQIGLYFSSLSLFFVKKNICIQEIKRYETIYQSVIIDYGTPFVFLPCSMSQNVLKILLSFSLCIINEI